VIDCGDPRPVERRSGQELTDAGLLATDQTESSILWLLNRDQ